jgi:hypothetical protein
MPDTKITALTAISTVDPAVDVLPIVDVSDTTMAASGTTKKITSNQILGAGGTATLASATITGDLTVDTSTLKVDSANNRVGIGTASPSYAADVSVAAVDGLRVKNTLATSAYFNRFHLSNDTGLNFIGYGPSFVGGTVLGLGAGSNSIFSDAAAPFGIGTSVNQPLVFGINGSTAMTLNSTGLGVGKTPAYRLDVEQNSAGAVYGSIANSNSSGSGSVRFRLFNSGDTSDGFALINNAGASGQVNILNYKASSLALWTNSLERMTIDTSGNVGVGVTPSAWGNNFKVVQVGQAGSVYSAAAFGYYGIKFNLYNDNTNDIAQTTNFVGEYRFELLNGKHIWLNKSTAGSIGVAQTLTQAMTLDASGDLLVGTTLKNGSWNTKLTLSNDSGTTRWAVGPYLGGVTNFLISAGAATGVYLNGTAATSWTSASDERLKDIIEPISNAVAKVGSLRAVIGKFKFDELNTRKPFLIAQDVQSVLPEAVDASNPDKLGVAYTDVIPLLVAAIKELTARVQTLEAK